MLLKGRSHILQVILTLEPLPEDQLQELTAGGEVRVGVRHDPSIRLQVQDAHWGGRCVGGGGGYMQINKCCMQPVQPSPIPTSDTTGLFCP